MDLEVPYFQVFQAQPCGKSKIQVLVNSIPRRVGQYINGTFPESDFGLVQTASKCSSKGERGGEKKKHCSWLS